MVVYTGIVGRPSLSLGCSDVILQVLFLKMRVFFSAVVLYLT